MAEHFNVVEQFGIDVFNEETMKQRLPKNVFKALKKTIAEGKGGFLRSKWCGSLECELAMKERAGVTSRCMPLQQSGTEGTCPVCGKPCKTDIYWGVAY